MPYCAMYYSFRLVHRGGPAGELQCLWFLHSSASTVSSRCVCIVERVREGETSGERSGASGGARVGPTSRATRPVALLALLEGLGTARLAMDAAINKAGGTAILCAS